MKLSVVIPIYNAESYIEKCVKSILSLPIEKEVLLIDDGSLDKSGEICDRLSAENSEVYVLHQENHGVSAARNRGLGLVKGDYVWFVDADDYIIQSPNVLYLNKTNWNKDQSPKLILLPYIWEENCVVKEYGAFDNEVPYNLWRCWFDCNEIKRQRLWFSIGRKYAEDQEFIWKFLLGCQLNAQKKQLIKTTIESPIYYYTIRPGSAMTRKGVKWKKLKDISAVFCGFFFDALFSGAIFQKWVWMELKRMAKTLYVTMFRK